MVFAYLSCHRSLGNIISNNMERIGAMVIMCLFLVIMCFLWVRVSVCSYEWTNHSVLSVMLGYTRSLVIGPCKTKNNDINLY